MGKVHSATYNGNKLVLMDEEALYNLDGDADEITKMVSTRPRGVFCAAQSYFFVLQKGTQD